MERQIYGKLKIIVDSAIISEISSEIFIQGVSLGIDRLLVEFLLDRLQLLAGVDLRKIRAVSEEFPVEEIIYGDLPSGIIDILGEPRHDRREDPHKEDSKQQSGLYHGILLVFHEAVDEECE